MKVFAREIFPNHPSAKSLNTIFRKSIDPFEDSQLAAPSSSDLDEYVNDQCWDGSNSEDDYSGKTKGRGY